MRRLMLLLFLALTAGFAPAPFPRAERRGKPVNELVGLWASGDKSNSQLEIAQDRMSYRPGAYDYALRLSPQTRPPSFSIRGIGRPNDGWEFNGVYRVEGDTLTLCYDSGPAKVTAFEGPGKGNITEVYKRVRR